MDNKKKLQKLIDDLKTKKFREGEAKGLTESIGDEIKKQLAPAFEAMGKDLTESMKGVKFDMPKNESVVNYQPPEINIPDFPEIPAPVVNVPAPIVNVPAPIVNVPAPVVNVPDFPTEMGLRDINKMSPLPVRLMDEGGKPFMFPVAMGASGGKADFFTIKGFNTSAFSELQNADGRLRVSVETGGSGITDAELRATAVPVSQVSGANWSVYVSGASGTIGVVTIDPDGNPTYASATSGLTDTELRASSVPVAQASGALWSTSVKEIFGSTITSDVLNADNRIRVSVETGGSGLTDSELRATAVPVSQLSGARWSTEATQSGTWNIGTVTTVTGITNTLASNIVDSSGVAYTTSNPLPIGDAGGSLTVDGTVAVSGVTNSIAASIVDSSGVMYGSANPLHIAVHDSTGSTISSFPSGDIKGLAVAIVDGSGAQITSFGGGTQYAEGATASTYTGTAVIFAEASSDAAKVVSSVDPLPVTLSTALSSSIDSVLSRPISLRGSLATAYATLSTNTETTLLAASSGFYRDLVWVKFSNTSTGAVTIDLRDITAGNIVDTYEVPANGTVGISMATPYPQGNIGNAWTVDYNDSDLSNTTVYVSAMFHNAT